MMKTMTAKQYQKQFEAEWNEWRDIHQSLSSLKQSQIRAGASFSLSKMMEGSGCGIGSSDINHSMFALWKSVCKDKDAYVKEGVNLYLERINE